MFNSSRSTFLNICITKALCLHIHVVKKAEVCQNREISSSKTN